VLLFLVGSVCTAVTIVLLEYCEVTQRHADHGEDTADSLERVIEPTISHLNKHLLYWLITVRGVHTLGRSKLLSYTAPRLNLFTVGNKQWLETQQHYYTATGTAV